MNTTSAIDSLKTMSEALERISCDPKYYNTIYGQYLEHMSVQMFNNAQDLKEISYLYGDVYDIT